MASSVEVHFRLTQDEDGDPIVAVELLLVEPGVNTDE